MFGIAIKTERSPYLRTLNDCRCRVRIKRIWTQTEIDKRNQKIEQIGQHAGRWTPDRIKNAHDLLFGGLSLTQAAKVMGISRKALTDALIRHKAMPQRRWV